MLDIVQVAEALKSADDLVRFRAALDFARQRVGATYYSASRIYDGIDTRAEDHVQNLPPMHLDGWLDPAECREDPVMQQLKHSSLPIYWDQDTYRRADRAETYAALGRVGLCQGVLAVMHMPHGEHFVLSFDFADTRRRDHAEVAHVIAATQTLIGYAELASRRVMPVPVNPLPGKPLTPRETECIRHVALGKTSADISLILGISERTVNKHVDSCMVKLNASNRTYAVNKAIRAGII